MYNYQTSTRLNWWHADHTFYFILVIFLFFSISQALYADKLNANGAVIMNTTNATKPAISSHKLQHARQNHQIFKSISLKLAGKLFAAHFYLSLLVHKLHNCYSYVNVIIDDPPQDD